jgi:hypothetical protein
MEATLSLVANQLAREGYEIAIVTRKRFNRPTFISLSKVVHLFTESRASIARMAEDEINS